MTEAFKKSWLVAALCVAFVVFANCAYALEQENDESGSLVGRISHIEGQLLRYVPDEDDWVLTEEDTPFGTYDNLFSSEDAKVEIIMPNNTLLRIGGDTQVQLIMLTADATEIDFSSGTARLYNRGSSTEVRATTPFGDVAIPPGAVCDVYVHEDQAEVAAIKGSVAFTKTGSTVRHELIAGSSSLIVTAEQIVASAHSAPAEWDSWNVDRDVQWTQRMQARGDSTKYLPESLQDHAWELDQNGRWERVQYDGAYRYFWRPAYVGAGWTPFSSGRWIVWHGEHTWVPCEPFGYVTHHYGNWVYAGSGWYWAPPVSHVMVSTGLPLLHIGFNWYPGRVAWVSSGFSIGWFPLAPYEFYYSSRYWGPWSRVRHHHHYYDCRRHRHYRHARFVDHRRFYGSRNYRHAGLRKGRHGEKFRGSSFIPPKIRRDFKTGNRHRLASNMPKYRDKLKKINIRRDKSGRQLTGSRLKTNPFKRTVVRNVKRDRNADKTVVKKRSKSVVKNTLPKRNRFDTAKKNVPKVRLGEKGKSSKTVKKTTGDSKTSPRTVRRSLQRPSKDVARSRVGTPVKVKKPVSFTSHKTVGNRKTLESSALRTRAQTTRKTATVRQGRARGNAALRNYSSAGRSISRRSAPTVSGRRPTAGSFGSSTLRSGNRGSQMRSSGRTQGFSARGRR